MLFVSRIFDALPPLSLVWRRIRPVVKGLGIAIWVLYRTMYCLWKGCHKSPSLWQLLVVPWTAGWIFVRQQLLLLLLLLSRGWGVTVSHSDNLIEDQSLNCQLRQNDDDPNTNLQCADAAHDELITVVNKLLNWIQLVVEDILFLAMITTTLRWVYLITSYGTRSSWKEWQQAIVHWTYTLASEHVPFVQRELQRQGTAFRAAAQQVKQKQRQPNTAILWKLPDQGRSYQSILEELVPSANDERENSRWHSGKQSGTVYYPPSEDDTRRSKVSAFDSNKTMSHSQFLSTCYALYSEANPLHYGCWPRVQQCEAEVLTMVGDLLHAPPPTCGCITSGGTESIVLAIRAQAAYFGRYVAHPELIAATTAHAAVRKACEMYGIRLVQVRVSCCGDNSFQLTPDRVRPYISANTVMIYASAPCYPQGVVDDIAGLGDLALRYNVGLHVDACLGGFVLPFYRDGVQFDFAASKGVTSISIDTHKYGMAAKGTSVVLYRHAELRHEQYFSYADWTGGLYATPTLAGSRPGGLSVAAWASLVSLGRDGLQDACDRIREAVEAMVQGIDSIDGIKVLGKKQYMVVCFCVDDQRDKDAAQLLDIYGIKDHMSEAFGWNLNDLQNPACVHLCVTLSVAPRATEFVQNLRDSVAHVRQQSLEQIQMGGPIQKRGMAAIYGTVQSVPAGSVEYLLKCYTDETLAP